MFVSLVRNRPSVGKFCLICINAGQDTTASAITWMVKYLGENQDVLDRLSVSFKLHYFSL